jgi:hypothetical protein
MSDIQKVAIPGDAEVEKAVRELVEFVEAVGAIAFPLKRLGRIDFTEALEQIERVPTYEDIGRLHVLVEDLESRLIEAQGYVRDINESLETLDILRVEAKRKAA